MTDHELALGRGAPYAADPDLSPAALMAAIAQAYASGGGAGDVPRRSPTAPPSARDLHDLLERAALEGRPPEPEDAAGHDPEPPRLLCQRCGWPISIRFTDYHTGPDWRWVHVLGSDHD